MKKVILTLAAVFAFGFANAQEEVKGNGFGKGSMFVSGAVSFGSESTGDAKESGFEIEPKFGYFVTDNIAVGGKIGFASQKAENAAGIDTQDDAVFSVGAFGRYYVTPANNFSLFGQLGLDYNTTEDKLADVKAKGFEIAVKPGISYFVSNNFAIEATVGQLGYRTTDNGGGDAESTDTFGLELDLRTIGFGMLYKF